MRFRDEDRVKSVQLTMPHPLNATIVHPDGRSEMVRFGHFESIEIVKENGWPVDRTKILIVPKHFVEEVETRDGRTVIFEEPFYLHEMSEFPDGKKAKSCYPR